MGSVTREWANGPIAVRSASAGAYLPAAESFAYENRYRTLSTPYEVPYSSSSALAVAPVHSTDVIVASSPPVHVAPDSLAVLNARSVDAALGEALEQAASLVTMPLPPPEIIEAHKAQHSQSVDAQVKEGSHVITAQFRQQRDLLFQNLWEQERHYEDRLDRAAALVRQRIDEQAQYELMQLEAGASQWKSVASPQAWSFAAGDMEQTLGFQLPDLPPQERRLGFNTRVDEQLAWGKRLINEQVLRQRERLEHAVHEQKVAHKARLNQSAVDAQREMTQLAQQRQIELQHSAYAWKSHLEQQACQLSIGYLHQEMQAKMADNRARMAVDLQYRQQHLLQQTQVQTKASLFGQNGFQYMDSFALPEVMPGPVPAPVHVWPEHSISVPPVAVPADGLSFSHYDAGSGTPLRTASSMSVRTSTFPAFPVPSYDVLSAQPEPVVVPSASVLRRSSVPAANERWTPLLEGRTTVRMVPTR